MDGKEYLQHYGILGMHWGRRKGSALGAKIATGRTASEDHDKVSRLKNKKLHEMSNAELKEFTTRLNLEKQYKDLTKVEKSKGMAVVKEILGNAAKQTAQTYVTKYMNKAVEELVKQASKGKGA
jgi:hypothetical protein